MNFNPHVPRMIHLIGEANSFWLGFARSIVNKNQRTKFLLPTCVSHACFLISFFLPWTTFSFARAEWWPDFRLALARFRKLKFENPKGQLLSALSENHHLMQMWAVHDVASGELLSWVNILIINRDDNGGSRASWAQWHEAFLLEFLECSIYFQFVRDLQDSCDIIHGRSLKSYVISVSIVAFTVATKVEYLQRLH